MRVDVLVAFAHLLRATRPHHGGVLRRAAAAPTGLRAVALGLRTAAAGSGRGRRPAALLPPPCHTHRAVTARQTLQAWPQMRAAVGIRQGMGVWMERVVAWGWPRSGTWSPLMDMALLSRSRVTPGTALPAMPAAPGPGPVTMSYIIQLFIYWRYSYSRRTWCTMVINLSAIAVCDVCMRSSPAFGWPAALRNRYKFCLPIANYNPAY